jgi:mannose-6-phosphate isomerase-like protein (cupin superfamily)
MEDAAALREQWFENAAMGQRARILTLPSETGGRAFTLEYVNRPHAGQFAIPAHFHPTWTESFTVLSGRARYRLGRKEHEAGAGETVLMPAGVAHVHPWSCSDAELHVRHDAVANPPDLVGLTASLQAIVTIFRLASEGRVNRRGVPHPLQLAVLARATMPATYLAGPPAAVQRGVVGILAGLGRLMGYRVSYPAFGELPRG